MVISQSRKGKHNVCVRSIWC